MPDESLCIYPYDFRVRDFREAITPDDACDTYCQNGAYCQNAWLLTFHGVDWRGLHLLPKWRPTRVHKKLRTQFWLSHGPRDKWWTRPPVPPAWFSRWWSHQSLFFNRNQRGNRQRITCTESPENFGADCACGVINLFNTSKYIISSHNW
jgi:hypothetical protein